MPSRYTVRGDNPACHGGRPVLFGNVPRDLFGNEGDVVFVCRYNYSGLSGRPVHVAMGLGCGGTYGIGGLGGLVGWLRHHGTLPTDRSPLWFSL